MRHDDENRLRALSAVARMSRDRQQRIGTPQYGPYWRGKKTVAELVQDAREELADAYAYIVDFYALERPHHEYERAMVRGAIADLWLATEAIARDAEMPFPGEPYVGEPGDYSQPPKRGPVAWDGG